MRLIDAIRSDFAVLDDRSTIQRFNNRGLHALTAYRIAHVLWTKRVPIVGQLLTRIVQILYGIDIDPRARLAPGIIIFHGIGLVIGPGAEIGEGSVLYNGVTIGAIDHHKRSRLPVLGKRVVVYCGAKVLGNISLGDDVVVGANAVVLKDVPAGCAAVGIPARSVPRREHADDISASVG